MTEKFQTLEKKLLKNTTILQQNVAENFRMLEWKLQKVEKNSMHLKKK